MDADNDHGDVRAIRRILFVTNAESGQANTILALALEASTRPQVEVHVASFPSLKKRVEKLSQKLNFHSLDGKDMIQVLRGRGITEQNLPHPPRSGVLAVYSKAMALIITVWDGESYMQVFDSIRKIIEELKPGIVVVDYLLNPGFDACRALNQEFVVNSPNPPLDVVRPHLPWLTGFWRFTGLGTGVPYPVSRRDLPFSIRAAFAILWRVLRSPEVAALNKYRNAHGLPGPLPAVSAPLRAAHVICPGVCETEFPLVIPDKIHMGLYGPIVLDTAPAEVADPQLNEWLNGGETVLMCMGTHFRYSEAQVKAIIEGFLDAAPRNSKVQFLWKLPGKSEFGTIIEETLNNPSDKDRFRIVDWLEADPASIMKHPNVVAWVHHGGANSYFEGTLAGLPQIILAQWLDLYDMAVRAEYLGIGIYGNKKVAPGIEAVEFGTAVARLLGPGKESEGFRERAKAVAEACRRAGGKMTAVDKLIEIVDGE